MNRTFSRLLAVTAALPLAALGLVATAPAASGTHLFPDCPETAPALLDFEVLGGNRTIVKRWDNPGNDDTYLCFNVLGGSIARWTLVVTPTYDVEPGDVTQVAGTGSCAQEIVDANVPVQLQLSVGIDPATLSVCLGMDDVTTTVGLAPPQVTKVPDVDLFIAPDTTLNVVPCLDQYLMSLAGMPNTYNNCQNEYHRYL